MKFMKKFPALIVLSLVLLLAACGGNNETSGDGESSDEEKFVIGVTHYSLQNEFPVLVSDAQKEKAEELGVEIKFFDGNYDPSTQLQQFENMITQGVDAIIFSPVDAKAMAGAVEMAAAQGVPVFGVNTKVESDDLTSYVGSNDVQAGEIEMQWMADKLGGKGNIVIIEGPLGSSAQLQRLEGIENILAKYPDIKVLAKQTGNWSRSEGLSLMENWLQAFPGQIDGVVGQNDEMAIGAVNALEEAGLKDEVPVVGVDAISDALTAVKEGRLDATVFQDAVGQGKMSVEVAVKHLKGEKVETENWIPFELVTPENVDDFK
jgi:inositol transport system substrate-binding protein